jgi:hypothetical protein
MSSATEKAGKTNSVDCVLSVVALLSGRIESTRSCANGFGSSDVAQINVQAVLCEQAFSDAIHTGANAPLTPE